MKFALLALVALAMAFPTPLQSASSVGVEDLRRHIVVLASDEFQGRKPGTEGETKSLVYIAAQFRAAGLEPGAGAGSWYQPVPLVERRAFAQRAFWRRGADVVPLDQTDLILIGREPVTRLAAAPVYFVGHGLARETEGADLKGAVVLVLFDPPASGSAPSYAERAKRLTEAGAGAIIAIVDDETPWSSVTASYRQGQMRLADRKVAPISGAMPMAAAQRLLEASGLGFDAPRAARLAVTADLEVSTEVRAYDSHNVIGKLRGAGKGRESLLYLGHWDHLGLCRPTDAADRICNGAVDNASGIATLIEVARHLARGKRPTRDILFMATTAEETGLLGAEYFAAHPVVPLKSLVAAINLDTVAIAEKGAPVAIVGRGTTPLDPLIDRTARELGRRVDGDREANAFIERQDGWALARAGIPSVMVGGAFSDMALLSAFLSGPYHKPNDDLGRSLVLDGAAEDADLLIALGRKLGDPKRYKRTRP